MVEVQSLFSVNNDGKCMYKRILAIALILFVLPAYSEDNGLAPEVTDLNAKDSSSALEKKVPYLKNAFIDIAPLDKGDGLAVGTFDKTVDSKAILGLANDIAASKLDVYDSFLISHKGKLVFESYYKRGRINLPHYQMSITKSYTALALGRAIQLGYLKMSDLDKPITHFLKDLKPQKFAPGAVSITIKDALNMHSGIRVPKEKVSKAIKSGRSLSKQNQIQLYLELTEPITPNSKTYKYQGSDPTIVMQVIDVVVPGGAEKFIENELLAKMNVEAFSWQNDFSGLPKAAAGSSMTSRTMVKWGQLILNKGIWNGEQLIPELFINQATSKVYTNKNKTSYGYFWWRHDMKVGDRVLDCKSGRGAGGQFILIFEELDLVVVMTSHNKGMGKTLKMVPERVLPAFLK